MNVLELFKPIKLIAMDVDGVLTDGSLILISDSHLARTMNIKDGYALQLAVKKGYHVMVISGAADNGTVTSRLNKLGITDVNMNVTDKAGMLTQRMHELSLIKNQVVFIGDDIPDYYAMDLAGLACCPSDAVQEIKDISSYISPLAGGKGCVRDVIEKILKLNQQWEINTAVSSS